MKKIYLKNFITQLIIISVKQQNRVTMNKQEYIQRVLNRCEIGTTLVGDYINAHTKITLKCPQGHLRTATTNSIMSRGNSISCKECAGKTATGKKTDATVQKEFDAAGLIKLEDYRGALVSILAKNISCGHTYNVQPAAVARGRKPLCPTCSHRRTQYSHQEFTEEVSAVGLVPLEKYAGMKKPVLVRNEACSHEYHITPGHMLYDGIGITCNICTGLGTSIKQRFFSKLLEYNITLAEEYTTTQTPTKVINNTCGHQYDVIPNNLVNADSGKVCRICTPTSSISQQELEVLDFIKDNYSGWIETNDRNILEGKELDIVIPDLGLAIEFNGAYWHSEESVGSNYHLIKTELVEAFGYKLIHIFDWEWETKRSIVQSRLLAALKKLDKIPARKTTIKEIDFPRQFLADNHIQGPGSITKYNFGLYYNEELVAVMTFGTPRFNTNYDYELVRYCTKLGTTAVGGAGKLLKAFQRKFTGSIISYSDRRWSQGGLYTALGFRHLHNSQPNYRYFKGNNMLTRYQCTKAKLRDIFPDLWSENKSETQIMLEAGWNKVYDSGNGVWVLETKTV